MVFGILGVLLTVRQNVWCWPAGIVNVLLFTLVFFHARLYGSSALQVVYLVLSVYGWRQWLHGGAGHGRLAVSRTPRSWAVALGVSGLLAAAVLATCCRPVRTRRCRTSTPRRPPSAWWPNG